MAPRRGRYGLLLLSISGAVGIAAPVRGVWTARSGGGEAARVAWPEGALAALAAIMRKMNRRPLP